MGNGSLDSDLEDSIISIWKKMRYDDRGILASDLDLAYEAFKRRITLSETWRRLYNVSGNTRLGKRHVHELATELITVMGKGSPEGVYPTPVDADNPTLTRLNILAETKLLKPVQPGPNPDYRIPSETYQLYREAFQAPPVESQVAVTTPPIKRIGLVGHRADHPSQL